MNKRGKNSWKENTLLFLLSAFIFYMLFFPLSFAFSESYSAEEMKLLNAFEKKEIIRLHIIANSDSDVDQRIKLAVRDAVIQQFNDLFLPDDSAGFEAVKVKLEKSREKIEQTAKDCVVFAGSSDSVIVETGEMWLPAKKYGNVLLPDGFYYAVRIKLGKATGRNWWCVLYPQLCLDFSKEPQPQNQFLLKWNAFGIFSNWYFP